ncbi:MAG: ABC transporter permease [Reyranella sp.]|nr:ABC transporter permease [Reyranella sp.]
MTNGTAGSAASGVAPAPRRWRRTLHRLQLMVAVTLLVAIVTAALFPAVVAPSEPNAIDLAAMLQPPSLSHPFGTDALGRDIFSRAVHGAQVSLLVAVSAVALAGAGGAILGIVAAYYRGFIDGVLMRLADVQFSLPAVILAMVLVGAIGANIVNLIIVLALANWARFARVIRSEALSLRAREFVLLAELAGASPLRVMAFHIAPNVRGSFIVLATLDIGIVVILEATLSFLGLGIKPPDPSWGNLIADGRDYLATAWWVGILPGLVLMALVLSCNVLGDWLRDRLSPTLSQKS